MLKLQMELLNHFYVCQVFSKVPYITISFQLIPKQLEPITELSRYAENPTWQRLHKPPTLC